MTLAATSVTVTGAATVIAQGPVAAAVFVRNTGAPTVFLDGNSGVAVTDFPLKTDEIVMFALLRASDKLYGITTGADAIVLVLSQVR